MLYSAYRIGIFLATHCPQKLVYILADIYACVWYVFDNQRKNRARAHLQTLLQYNKKNCDTKELDSLTFGTFQNFSKYLFEVFRISLVDNGYVEKYIQHLDASELDRAINEGKGVIIFTAHFGNWELAGVGMALLGYPTIVVALSHSDPRINQLFLGLREKFGMSIIDLDKYAARECLRTLRNGKILALLGDEDFSDTHIEIEYLGEIIRVPRGAAALSRAAGTPVLPSLMVRQPDNRFVIHHEKAIYPVYSENQEEDIQKMTKEYMNALAPYFLKYPEQWFRFK